MSEPQWNVFNVSELESKVLEGVSFHIKILAMKEIFKRIVTTCQILNQMLCNLSDFKSKILQSVNFFKESLAKFLPFESKFLQSGRNSTRSLQRVRFRIKISTTCPIWKQKIKHVGI